MSLIAKRRGQGAASAIGQKVLTAKMFLGKDGHEPYMTPSQLIDLIDNGRAEDAEEMERFIDLAFQQRKFSLSKRVRTDAGGKAYTYQNFVSSKGSEGVKVLVLGNIQQFIADYHAGLFITDFNFEQLVAEAESQD